MPKKPKILFVHLGRSSFVKEDLKILSENFEIIEYYFNPRKFSQPLLTGLFLLWNFLKQLIWLILNIRTARFTYCWFSDYHAALPVMLSKFKGIPVYTVLGGFDCIKMPHLNYGIFCSTWRAPLGRFVTRNSTVLLPVTNTLYQTDEISKGWPDAHPNGLKANVSNLETPIIELHTGYDSDVWEPGSGQREPIVSTVAACSTLQIAKRKGLDLFIETSKITPDFTFNIVGVSEELKVELISEYSPGSNLKFIPRQQRSALNKVYTDSSVYLQLSRAEGLPNVLCEAMMCGCIPVGSTVFGIPKGIGDTGFLIKQPDIKKISEAILKAHSTLNTPEERKKVRHRVEQYFSIERRKKSLIDIVNKVY